MPKDFNNLKNIISDFEKNGKFDLLIDSETISIDSSEIEIVRTGLHGWSVESENGLTVALDTKISDALKNEGIAREFVNRVQNMRKEADFDVTDRIAIYCKTIETIQKAIKSMENYICDETLSLELHFEESADADYTKTWDIDSEEVIIGIKRATL
jgi:isoleucyl-tRNA synthetase